MNIFILRNEYWLENHGEEKLLGFSRHASWQKTLNAGSKFSKDFAPA